MIPYIEILDKYTLKAFAVIEPKECWFELSYYENGQCEVYCNANSIALSSLLKGNYLRIPNKEYIWVITSIAYSYNAEGTRMIDAKGYEAKWILHSRIIMNPAQLPSDLRVGIYGLVDSNAISSSIAARNIQGLQIESYSGAFQTIDDTQASRSNLLDFTNNLLKIYKCGGQVVSIGNNLVYHIYRGVDRSQTIIFSQSFDNLLSSEYYSNNENLGTFAFVVSKVEDVDYTKSYDKGQTGIDRSEILVESNLSTKYTDDQGVERETTPTSSLYQGWMQDEGHQKLEEHLITEEIKGEIDLERSSYKFDEDFFLGDLIQIRDEYFNYSTSTRILKVTFKQDSNGYGEEINYGGN